MTQTGRLPRIVQVGSGARRPLVLVYHLKSEHDSTLKAAIGPSALIANDSGPTGTGYYSSVPPLADTVAALSQQTGATLGPVLLAGFSEGGLVTRSLLDGGADPNALVIADGTYGSSFASWKAFADRARDGQRVMIASYSSNMPSYSSPVEGLRYVTGFNLGIGASAPRHPDGIPTIDTPTMTSAGALTVYGFPDLDHRAQGASVLPRMIAQALSTLGVDTRGQKSAAGALLLVASAAAAIALIARR